MAADPNSDDIRQLGPCLTKDLTATLACQSVLDLYENRLSAVEERINALLDVRSRLRSHLAGLRTDTVHRFEQVS